MLMGQSPLTDIELDFGCDQTKVRYLEVCRAYAQYLTNCPAMQTGLCHADQGGSEALLAPCPTGLIAYYCVRFNPAYMLAQVAK